MDFADFGLFREIKSTQNVEFPQNMPKNKGKWSKLQRMEKSKILCPQNNIYIRAKINPVKVLN